MGKVLDVELFVYDKLVFGKIKSQNDAVIKRGGFFFKASNGFTIESMTCPDLSEASLFINGNKSTKDSNMLYHLLSTQDDAREFANKVKLAVEELNIKFKEVLSTNNSIEKIM